MPVRVLLVDDQQPFRLAARDVIALSPGFILVGEADSGEVAVELAAGLLPDLALMDINLPGIDGVEAARRIREKSPETAVVFVSTYARADYEPGLSETGAAFVPKAEFSPKRLARAWSTALKLAGLG